MILTCKCLNILLETNTNNILPFRKYDILSDEEKRNEFFKDLDLGFIRPTTVCKGQPFLIHMVDVGSWIVYRCLNCLCYTHAVNSTKNEVVVNRALLLMSKEELSVLEKSDAYSTVFKVLILNKNEMNHDDDNSDDRKEVVFLSCDLKDLTEKAISALENKVKEIIRDKERETEEQIRSFTEKQYAALNEYKEQAREECKAITRNLLIARNETVQNTRVEFNSSEVVNITSSADNNNQIKPAVIDTSLKTKTKSDYSSGKEAKRQISPVSEDELEFAGNIAASYDCEGLFPLDGMDIWPADMQQDEEEERSEEDSSDTEDSISNDEGIHIPRRRSNAIARSLPIRVPVDFDTSFQWSDENKANPNAKRERRERPKDIAASIKALANSVHGETLFGDLPPPRIGSRI